MKDRGIHSGLNLDRLEQSIKQYVEKGTLSQDYKQVSDLFNQIADLNEWNAQQIQHYTQSVGPAATSHRYGRIPSNERYIILNGSAAAGVTCGLATFGYYFSQENNPWKGIVLGVIAGSWGAYGAFKISAEYAANKAYEEVKPQLERREKLLKLNGFFKPFKPCAPHNPLLEKTEFKLK